MLPQRTCCPIPASGAAVEALDDAGKVTRKVAFTADGAELVFGVVRGDLAYRVRWR
jgi:hypothetical protein